MHPSAEAVATCERCGRFFCAAEEVPLDGKRYCGECGKRDDVDWLGAHYGPLIGKRSGFAWSAGIIALMLGAFSVLAFFSFDGPIARRLPMVLGLGVLSAALFAFFSGVRWGRVAPLVAAPVFGIGLGLMSSEWLLVGTLCALVPLLFGAAGWTDVRSKLFFSVEVDRPALHKHFKLYGNNPLAVVASRLAFVSLLIPGMSVLAFVLGVIALARVNRTGTPPVTNAGTAIGAMIFSLITGIAWASAFLA